MSTGYWADPTYVGEPDPIEHTGFLLAEDAALKNYLQGMVVPDRSGTSSVPVWFRYPEGERRTQFPFITIDLIGVNPSFDRWQSIHVMKPLTEQPQIDNDGNLVRTGLYRPSVSPTLVPGHENTAEQVTDQYQMYEILYQVTVHCRSSLHDRVLLSRFMTDIFPPRPFWIPVDADMTWRRCELREMVQADIMETTESGSKRVFRKIHTISMDAEIPTSAVAEFELVTRIHIDMYEQGQTAREAVGHAFDAAHTVASENLTTTPDYLYDETGTFPGSILQAEDGLPLEPDVPTPPGP